MTDSGPIGDAKDTSPLSCRTIKVGLANCFSIRNKVYSVLEMMVENNVGLLAVTETWLNEDEAALAVEFEELGFTLVSAARSGRKGGGVGFVLRKDIKYTVLGARRRLPLSSVRRFTSRELLVFGSPLFTEQVTTTRTFFLSSGTTCPPSYPRVAFRLFWVTST